jgi:penicillin amidase
MIRRTGIRILIWFCFLQSIALFPGRAVGDQGHDASQQDSRVIEIKGLGRRVTVWRDERGVPFIEASNEADLYFAQGYVTAGDRLWQMDLLRRTARGEAAMVLGRGALEEDKYFRKLGFATLVEQTLHRLSPRVRAALESYTRGVNAAIESLDDKSLPAEFRALKYRPSPWQPTDTLVIGKLFAETLSPTWLWEVMRESMSDLPAKYQDELYPSTSPLDVVIVGRDSQVKTTGSSAIKRPASPAVEPADLGEASKLAATIGRALARLGLHIEDGAASNNWVVNGRRTLSGKPLLANDPHLDSSAPGVWYLTHLSAPGLRVAGAAIPGSPGIVIGHNERIAWGITNLFADIRDLYHEKFDKGDSKRYLTPQGWREAKTRREEIKVRKSPLDPTIETVALDVCVTRHGPIILESNGKRYALKWTALDASANELEVYYWINRSGDWRQFRRALSGYTGVGLNYIYADREGNIGYWGAGLFPIRKTGDGSTPNDGATDWGEWTGYIPFQAMPHVYNPPSGLIVTANNRMIGSSYPYKLTRAWIPPYRARRIYNSLVAEEKLTVESFLRIQADTYSYPDATFIGELIKLARPLAASSTEWREVLARFDGWDGRMNTDSQVALLAYRIRIGFIQRTLNAVLGPERLTNYSWPSSTTLLDSIIISRPKEWLPKEFASYEDLLLACYKSAKEELTRRFGSDESKWTWGRHYQMRFPHALAGVPSLGTQFALDTVPQNGSVTTVNRGESVSMRFVADLSDWDNTRQCLPLGQSGDPASPHWKDQLPEWFDVNPRPFPFSEKSVKRSAQKILTMIPHTVK